MQVFTNAFVGVWALAAHRSTAMRHASLWWCTAVAYLVAVGNLVMASVLVARKDWVFPEFHMLYEYSSLVAVGIIYSYAKQLPARRFLIYGFGSLFIMGLALRALYMLGTTAA